MEECEERYWTIAILHLFGGLILLFWFFRITSPLDNPSAFDPILVWSIWLLISGAVIATLGLKGGKTSKAILAINLIPAVAGILWCYGVGEYIVAAAIIFLVIAASIWAGEITPLLVAPSAILQMKPDIETATFVLLVMVMLSALRAYTSIPVSLSPPGVKIGRRAVKLGAWIALVTALMAGAIKMMETLRVLAGKEEIWSCATTWSTMLAAIMGALLTMMAAAYSGRIPLRGLIWMMVVLLGIIQGVRWISALALATSMWETQRAIPLSGRTGAILVGTDYTAIGSSLLMLGCSIPKSLSHGFMAFAPMETALVSAISYLLILGLLASGILEIRGAMAG